MSGVCLIARECWREECKKNIIIATLAYNDCHIVFYRFLLFLFRQTNADDENPTLSLGRSAASRMTIRRDSISFITFFIHVFAGFPRQLLFSFVHAVPSALFCQSLFLYHVRYPHSDNYCCHLSQIFNSSCLCQKSNWLSVAVPLITLTLSVFLSSWRYRSFRSSESFPYSCRTAISLNWLSRRVMDILWSSASFQGHSHLRCFLI